MQETSVLQKAIYCPIIRLNQIPVNNLRFFKPLIFIKQVSKKMNRCAASLLH